MAEITKASVFAIKEETTVGELIAPTVGTDYIPLRSGFSMEPGLEELENDELLNSIGSSKSVVGKESPSGSHNVYLKHSETEGQAPEYGLMIESAMGAKDIISSEKSTDTGSTVAVLELPASDGDVYREGHAVMIKDGTNGYSIRNVASKSGDSLTMSFQAATAPLSGVQLGQPVLYYPVSSGHPSFSTWLYNANGALVQAVSGARTSSMALALNAGQQAEINFSYAGTEYFFNPFIITASNKYIDFTDDQGTAAAVLTEGAYKSPLDLARQIESAMEAVTTEDVSVAFASTGANAGKFTIACSGAVFSLLWDTGVNSANSAGTLLGYDVASDDTGSLSYNADNVQDYSAPHTPIYDDADNIVVKGAELLLGDATDNICREASAVSFSIETPGTDVDDVCAASGVAEKLILERQATMTASLILKKHEVKLFDRFINGTGLSVSMSAGPKSGGNWIPGKCVNIYFKNATITAETVSGDDFLLVEITAKGYVTSASKEVFINFI